MSERCRVFSRMVEFLRLGDPVELLSPSRPFIRTAGSDGLTKPVAPTITHQDLDDHLDRLRYNPATPLAEVEKARYGTAYAANINSHWNGIQHLALEAVLDGRLQDPHVWSMVRHAAGLHQKAHPKDYWSGGTLVELFLLRPLVDDTVDADRTREAVRSFRERVDVARTDGDVRGADFALQSTRRQVGRYVTWWTKANGFFPGREKDLAEDAQVILALLR